MGSERAGGDERGQRTIVPTPKAPPSGRGPLAQLPRQWGAGLGGSEPIAGWERVAHDATRRATLWLGAIGGGETAIAALFADPPESSDGHDHAWVFADPRVDALLARLGCPDAQRVRFAFGAPAPRPGAAPTMLLLGTLVTRPWTAVELPDAMAPVLRSVPGVPVDVLRRVLAATPIALGMR